MQGSARKEVPGKQCLFRGDLYLKDVWLCLCTFHSIGKALEKKEHDYSYLQSETTSGDSQLLMLHLKPYILTLDLKLFLVLHPW